MKVFEFDPVTGKRGALIEEISRPTGTSNMKMLSCKLPQQPDSEWRVATEVERGLEKLSWDRPVCFCLGQMTAGTDTSWWWIAYLPWFCTNIPE